MPELTHFDKDGAAAMVDVSKKPETARIARAACSVYMAPETLALIMQGGVKKGDVFGVARLAGIMGAKRASDLIPLCHPLPLSKVSIELSADADRNAVDIMAEATVTGRTGVEMEALTAVSVAALTVYDMCKAADRRMRIDNLRLIYKTGGKSGTYNEFQ